MSKGEMEDQTCYFCGERNEHEAVFVNGAHRSFKYMTENAHAHIECYIEEGVRLYLEKLERVDMCTKISLLDKT